MEWFCCWLSTGMDILKRWNIYVLIFLSLYGMVLGQYMQCPAEDWTVGSTITLRCYLPKDIYPDRCTTGFTGVVTFYKQPLSAANTKCNLSSVSTASCSSSSSDCSCESGNSTHYSLQYTFTVDTEDAGTWACTVRCVDTNFDGQLTYTAVNCDDRDVVVHAELSTPTITVTTLTTGSGWTVRGSVNITRIFSTAGQYPCVWSVRKDSGLYTNITNKAATIDSPVSSTSVRTGHCDFPDRPLSSAPGTYTYRVTVSPGHTTKTDSSVVVAQPSADPMVSCNDQNSYILENTSLTCNCTASDLGKPQGRLVVFRDNAQRVPGNYGESSVQFGKSIVSSSDNNAVFRCVLDWATADNQDINTTYTLKVAYGPSSVDLTNPPVHELDPTQSSTQLTLTCTAVGVNPRATYIWNGSQCAGTTQSTCSFTPTKDDAGAVISCTAVNPISNVRKTSGERTLTIHYPPSSEPKISGYSGGVLYAGQTTTMTCTVTGGNPAVSSVTLTCDTKGQEVSGTSSNISVTASRDHDGRNCTCSAKWKNKPSSWYPKTAVVILHVFYPPDPPTIDYKQQHYPFLAGESPTLYCTLPTGPYSGNPPASLTFEGPTGSQGEREIIVTLSALTNADHGRLVVCNATNNFTEHTGTDVTGNITLQVYYLSPIVTPMSSIICSMMTSAGTCEVKEGQQVHLNCSADSNPSLANAAWQQGSPSSLNFIANRSTSLYHVCHVKTTTVNSDDRLPLKKNFTLTVLTTYPAQVSEFTSDNSNNVSEGESPTLTCKAVGRPTPAMIIGKDDVILKSRQKGQVTAEQQASLTHILHATCNATGQYSCEVTNGGQASTTHLMVFVKCSPRQQEGTSPIPSYLNYKGGSISTVFPLTVYPAIRTSSLEYLSHNSSRPARDTLYTVNCTVTQSSRPHLTTCNLTISGATQHDKGLYDLTLDNGVGQPFTFRLQLDVNGTDSKAFPIAAAVGGVLAAGAAVTVAAAGIFIFRRKQREKKEHYERAKNGRRRNTEEPEMITNELYGTAGPQGDDDGEDETMIVNTMYETSETVGAHVAARRQENASAYEDVAHDGIRPMVTPGPPPAAASGATETGLYAIVDKGRQGQPTASTSAAPSDDTNVYAAVDKSKKKSAPPQTAAKPEVKPKPGKKPKDKKKKKNSTKPDAPQPLEETEDTANLYGNIGTTSRTAPPGEDGTVYENHAFTGDEGAVGGSQVEATTAGGGSNERSRTVNADGLVYTTVAFSESQRQKEHDPFPGREKTEYAKIGFPVKALADQE